MVMISFAALMTAAEMTSNEVKKNLVQYNPLLVMLGLGFVLASMSPNPGVCIIIIILSGMFLYAVSH